MAMPSQPNLAGLRVLVTRPIDRSAELQSALCEAGATVVLQPLLAIAELLESSPAALASRQRIMNLTDYQHLIFISVNAVEHGLDLVDQFWPQWPLGLQVHAIGAATAAALKQRDIAVASGNGLAMNSESLLQNAALQNLQGQKVLIFRGLGGREYLAEQLLAQGARVDYAECYQRLKPEIDSGQFKQLLLQQKINTICVNSGETLAHLHELLIGSADQFHLLLPSERVVALARELGFKRLLQAENAGTEASLKALQVLAESIKSESY
jgi:uroporphyrinogen-III synthase